MTQKRLFLYPGAHKTATSMLQAAMELNRPALEASGLAVLRRQRAYKSGMRELLAVRNSVADMGPGKWQALCDESLGQGWQDRDIVLSLENVFGEFVPPYYRKMGNCIGNLQALFPDHRMEVVFYVRRQDSFLESLYTQQIHRGRTEGVEAFWERYREHPIDWLTLLRPLFKRVGRDAVTIRAFETIKKGPEQYAMKFFRDFTDLPQKQLLKGFKDLSFTNLSLSEFGLRIAQAAYAEIPEMRDRRRLAKALQPEFGNDKYPRYRMSDALREEIVGQHREVNKRLVKKGTIPKDLADYYLFKA